MKRSALWFAGLFFLGLVSPTLLLRWNGFPFLYWDSSEYLFRWVDGRPGWDRPIFYSLWVSVARFLPGKLGGLALLQAAVTVALLLFVLRKELPSRAGMVLGAIALVQLSPSVVHEVTLMPDIATLWLAFLAALLFDSKSPLEASAWALVAASVGLWHSSSLWIVLLSVPAFVLLAKGRGCRLWPAASGLALFLTISILGICWNSYRFGAGFRPKSAARLFLSARIQESGLLADGVERSWSGDPVAPVFHVDDTVRELRAGPKTPEWFLWDPTSPLNRRFEAWREDPTTAQQAELVFWRGARSALSQSPGAFARTGLDNAWRMIGGLGYLEGFVPHRDGSGVDRVLAQHWVEDRPESLGSHQNAGLGESKGWRVFVAFWRIATNWIVVLVVALFFLSLVRRRRSRRLSSRLEWLAGFFLTFYIFNLLVCAFASSSASRYQERIAALPLLAIWLFVHAWRRTEEGKLPASLRPGTEAVGLTEDA
jgi:hypothetical protein